MPNDTAIHMHVSGADMTAFMANFDTVAKTMGYVSVRALQAAQAAARANTATEQAKTEPVEPPKSEPEAPVKPKRSTKKADEPTPEPEPPTDDMPAHELPGETADIPAAEPETTLTVDDAKDGARALVAVYGMPGLALVNYEHGITLVPDLKPAQYGGYIAQCRSVAALEQKAFDAFAASVCKKAGVKDAAALQGLLLDRKAAGGNK